MNKKATPEKKAASPAKQTQPNGADKPNSTTKAGEAAKPGRAISDPREVAQLVMLRIDHVNAQKDELTIAVKALADTAKQLVSVYANQQGQISKLAKRLEELEKQNAKS